MVVDTQHYNKLCRVNIQNSMRSEHEILPLDALARGQNVRDCH